MAAKESVMLPLGTTAPKFKLYDTVSGKYLSFDELKGPKGTLVMFICNHCPYVKHVNQELVRLGNDYMPKGIGFIAISSNDVVRYPDDSPEKMKEVAEKLGYPFPYLYDETQETARAYQAACTPDFFLFDAGDKLVYRGQLDDSRPGNDIPVTGKDLRKALDYLLEGKIIPEEQQKPSIGCSIKWKE
jgi:peroxiredoxin